MQHLKSFSLFVKKEESFFRIFFLEKRGEKIKRRKSFNLKPDLSQKNYPLHRLQLPITVNK